MIRSQDGNLMDVMFHHPDGCFLQFPDNCGYFTRRSAMKALYQTEQKGHQYNDYGYQTSIRQMVPQQRSSMRPPELQPTLGSSASAGKTKKAIVTASSLNIRRGPGKQYPIIGRLKHGETIHADMSGETWARIKHGTENAYVSKRYLRSAENDQKLKTGQLQKKAVSLASSYLGRTTKDLVGELKYLKDLGRGKSTNKGYNLNCANFVSAILKQVGLIGEHVVGCGKLRNACKSYGYKTIGKSQARPGDVWIGDGHTELVHSVCNDIIFLIGSNNGGTKVQKITIDAQSAQKGGEIYSIQSSPQRSIST